MYGDVSWYLYMVYIEIGLGTELPEFSATQQRYCNFPHRKLFEKSGSPAGVAIPLTEITD
jgi:hypothetical protein